MSVIDKRAGTARFARRRGGLAALTSGMAVCTALLVSGCASGPEVDRAQQTRIELPLVHGWYEGQIADYVTTDMSSQAMALVNHANYAPRLANLLPANQPRPNPHSAIARIYKFLNYPQPSVLPSVPAMEGVVDAAAYSPLWELMGVTWQAGHAPRELRSEDEVLKAQAAGELVIAPLNVIVNCPVVRVGEHFLPETRLASH